MRFESAALVLVLLVSGDAFLVPNAAIRRLVAFHNSHNVEEAVSKQHKTSPLPPSQRNHNRASPPKKQWKSQKYRGKYNNNKNKYNNNESSWENYMPKNVPKLSDVLKSATLQDFSGDVSNTSLGSEESASGEDKVEPEPLPEPESVEKEPPAQTARVANEAQQQQPPRRNAINKNGVSNTDQSQKSKQGQQKQQDHNDNDDDAEPWKANYRVSKQTQGHIKAAAHPRNHGGSTSPTSRAIHVMETLLNQDFRNCNPANVVCALTLSAKILGASPHDRYQHDELRNFQFETLDILHDLVLDQRLSARQLCNAVWAIAKFYNRDSSLLPPPPQTAVMSTDKVLGTAETWVLQNEPTTSAEKRVCETVDAIAKQLTDILKNKEQQQQQPKVGEISMATWAYGVLRPRRLPPGWSSPPQMGKLPKQQQQQQQQQSGGGVEYITFEQWSKDLEDNDQKQEFACSNDVTDELLDAVGEALCKDPMAVDDDFYEHKEESGSKISIYNDNSLVRTLTWNEIANVAWAYATHGHSRTLWSEQVMLALAKEAARRLDEGDPERMLSRDVAQLVWALGTLQSDNFRLGDDLVELIDAIAGHYLTTWGHDDGYDNSGYCPLKDWSCPDLVQVAISMAHGRIDHLPMLNALYEESIARLYDSTQRQGLGKRRAFRTWELSVLLWAQARLYLRSPQGAMFDGFCQAATRRLVSSLKKADMSLYKIGIGPQEQANIAWSLTVLEEVDSPEAITLLHAIFQEAADTSENNHVIQLEHAHQLWQSLFLLEEASPQSVQNVPTWFREFLKEKWSVEKSRRKLSSARHRSLSQTLKLMGVAHYNEHDEDIDVAIVLKDDSSWTNTAKFSDHNDARFKVAVEFDGPNHFTREVKPGEQASDPGSLPLRPRALGHTVLKYRLLKRQGWTVVRVPYYEFDKIPFWASMERQRYLQRLLKTHANINFSAVDVSEYKPMVPNRSTRFD